MSAGLGYPEREIKEAIITAAADWNLDGEAARDVAFHMTDWLADLKEWQCFCQGPDALDSAGVQRLLSKVLIHVPPHLAAARKLLLDLPMEDTFEVGIFDEPG